MDRAELRAIIAREGLAPLVCLDEDSLQEHAAVLEPRDGGWVAYLSGERATAWEGTVRHFDDESSALEYLVMKLRQTGS